MHRAPSSALVSRPRFVRLARLALLAAAFALLASLAPVAGPVRAEEGAPAAPAAIAFHETLAEAFAAAKEQDLPIMICINARNVDGGRVEPAARELRTKTYKAPAVIEKSTRFVCAYLTSGGSSEDFGELRLRYGIDGEIVSPQHIFAYPDGRLIFRREYWPYGTGQRAVDALLGLMDDALGKDRAKRAQSPADGKPAPGAEEDAPMHEEEKAPVAPESGEERAKWIQEQLDAVRLASDDERRAACKALVENDKEGDTLTPLLALLAEMKKHPDIQVDIVRAMGKPGLVLVVEGVCDLLGSKHADVRANAAVTLEYIGSPEALSDLRKRAPKEKEENIANHMYRAIGRCGAGDAKVRAFLVKKATGAKSNLASYGPIIGIAYFEKDEKAARDVEKLITRVSGGWQGGAKRALLVWCLAEVGVGNAKSAKFIREKVVPGIRENQWTARFVPYYEAAADCCDGDTSARAEVERGASGALSFGRGGNPLMDEARRGRDTNLFTPKADWEGGGGGGGGPGGGPGGGGPGGGGGGAPRNP